MVVAHDPLPATWSPARALTVPGLLDSLPEMPALLWLDFKNLSYRNVDSAAASLDALARQHGFQRAVIVEAKNPWVLWRLRRRTAAVLPAYWIPTRPGGARAAVYDAKLALVLGALALPALSVPKKQLTSGFARRFGRFALFTWTWNTPQEVRVATRRGARIILVDADSPAAPQNRSASGAKPRLEAPGNASKAPVP